MSKGVRYVAVVPHVREVSLRGTADLDFWTDRLRHEELVPASEDGKAQVLVIAAELRYLGIRFRELSLSVAVERPGTPDQGDAAFLVQAWSSSRLLAWCERAIFSTPYTPGEVRVAPGPPSSIRLAMGGEDAFHATMEADADAPARVRSAPAPASWEGPVFLPRRRGAQAVAGQCFFVRLSGPTWTSPFLPSRDAIAIKPSRRSEALRSLAASGFTPVEWLVREDAVHARSKTFSWPAAAGALTSSPPGVG